MRIIECDRCHKRIENTNKAGYINLDWRDIKTGELEGSANYDNWDLCEECKRAVEDFLHMKPAEFIPEAETKKKRIDRGRIRALHQAGWSVREIAEDLGCSEPTVRKYIDDNEGISKSDKTPKPED